MKKLLIIILLLFSFNAFGQVYFSGTRQPIYSTRATQFFDRCVTAGVTLTTAQKQWYDDSIFTPLLDSGLIGTTRAGDSIQALWCFALFPNGSANVAVLNLLSDSNTCLAVNSPTFTDSGVVGNGSSSYLNSNFNPSWDSSIYKLNSAGFGVYSKTDANGNYTDMGSSQGLMFNRLYTRNTQVRIYINNKTELGINTANSLGYYLGIRNNSNSIFIFKNTDTLITSSSNVSIALTNYKFGICCDMYYFTAQNFTTRCYPFAYITSGLSTDKTRKLGNILNNSLKGRGYNVY